MTMKISAVAASEKNALSLNYGSNRLQGSQVSLRQYLTWQYSAIVNFSAAQMWFVVALLAFAVVYVIWRRFAKPMSDSKGAAPGNAAIAIFALLLGLVTFVVRIWLPVGWELPIVNWQLPHFPQYIALYILGIVAYRRNWFEAVTDAQGKTWFFAVVGLVLCCSFPSPCT